MLRLDGWQEIGETLRRHKLRTALTALSVAWGIFILVVLLGAGSGLEHGVNNMFRDDAINSLWIWPGETTVPYKGLPAGRPIPFDNDDYAAVRDTLPGVAQISGRFYFQGQFQVIYGDKHASFDIRAVHPGHQYLEKTLVTAGRFLDDLDLEQRRKVAVLGAHVAEFLFGSADPIGAYISIRGLPYKVIGVFHDLGGEREEREIYVPITTAQVAYNAKGRLHQLMFTIDAAHVDHSQAIERDVRELLARRHDFSAGDRSAVRVRNNLEEYGKVSAVLGAIRIFLWIVGIGTVIAGIVAVSNIMLISVTERTREIGVRKALGATPASIIGMVIQEALALTAASGYVGLVLGVLVLQVAGRNLPQNDFFRDPQVSLSVAVAATVLLVLAGTLAGFFPARRAARVNPIAALRDE